MKRIITGLFAATLLATSAAWADDDDRRGRGRGHGHGHGHGDKHWKHEQKELRKFEKHAWKHQRHHREVVVHHYAPAHRVVERHHVYHYAEPAPVYVAPPPAGVHVVLPNVFIPLR